MEEQKRDGQVLKARRDQLIKRIEKNEWNVGGVGAGGVGAEKVGAGGVGAGGVVGAGGAEWEEKRKSE